MLRPSSSSAAGTGSRSLLTVDNGEDHTKPTTLDLAAWDSLARALDEIEAQDWAGCCSPASRSSSAPAPTSRCSRPRARAETRADHRAGPRAVGAAARAAVPDGRRDQRRLHRRRRRARAPLRRAHDRDERPPLRLPGVLPRDHPRLGRHAADPAARRRATAVASSSRTRCANRMIDARRRSSSASPIACSSRSSSSTSRSRTCSS